MNKMTLVAVLAALSVATSAVALDSPLGRLDIVSDDFGPLPEYQAAPTLSNRAKIYPPVVFDGKTWVPGENGERYSIRLRNNTSERVLAVVSVDGINVIDGKDAGYGGSGYVLAPYEQTTVDGWRKSMRDVARFYFTDVSDSYANRTGRPANVGVVGVAFFREREPVRILAPSVSPYSDRYSGPSLGSAREKSATAQSSDALREESRLGTGHGERVDSRASRTTFERASVRPDQVLSLFYDSRENLVRKGIMPRPGKHHFPQGPNPFPSERGFVPDPR